MKSKKQNKGIATVTFLGRDQVDYLDKLAKDSSFKYGHKLTRTKVLSELVSFLMKLSVTLEDINLNQESLSDGLLKVVQRMHHMKSFSAEEVANEESIEVAKDQGEQS